jgi:ABC-type nitrate/sulfonate/bicarbonate transport system permease component
MKGLAAIRQIRSPHWQSCFGAGMLWILFFAFWDVFYPFLRDVFMIAPLRHVLRAAYRLLTTGSVIANMESTLWWDIAASIREIGEGLLLGGVLAYVLVRVLDASDSRIRLSWILALTHILPIIIAVRLIMGVGIGHWFKVIIIAASCLFPFGETLWGVRTAPRVTRLLIALDNALPYAFAGMLLGEAWASTECLGFFIIVARASGNRTEALAASMIALAAMALVSLLLRFTVNRLNTSEPGLMPVSKRI